MKTQLGWLRCWDTWLECLEGWLGSGLEVQVCPHTYPYIYITPKSCTGIHGLPTMHPGKPVSRAYISLNTGQYNMVLGYWAFQVHIENFKTCIENIYTSMGPTNALVKKLWGASKRFGVQVFVSGSGRFGS